MASLAPPVSPGVRARPPAFGKRGVLALVGFGTIAFIAFLYLVGAGQLGGSGNNGQAHAASKGLTGFAALVRLAEASGHDVSLSRSEGSLDEPGLLVLTPPPMIDEGQLGKLIERRRFIGPTLVILPKWYAAPVKSDKARPGWVAIGGPARPDWAVKVSGRAIKAKTAKGPAQWVDIDGNRGTLPSPAFVQTLAAPTGEADFDLVSSSGLPLASIIQNTDTSEGDAWPVTIVAEPDLMNNWGLADEDRADLAHWIVDEAAIDTDLPVTFDLTLNGLASSRNLLSLAFEPPFLAATLCLLAALLLVGWRAFRRFGPALAESQAMAFGKGQLVENGAGVIQRTGRMHLLTRPYASLVETRIARRLGLRRTERGTIDEALRRRGLEPLSPRLAALEQARHRTDIIRAARALHSLERTITR